jgi:hypothetical protein
VLPDASTTTIRGAGHMSPLTHRDQVNDLVIAHLDANTAQRRNVGAARAVGFVAAFSILAALAQTIMLTAGNSQPNPSPIAAEAPAALGPSHPSTALPRHCAKDSAANHSCSIDSVSHLAVEIQLPLGPPRAGLERPCVAQT